MTLTTVCKSDRRQMLGTLAGLGALSLIGSSAWAQAPAGYPARAITLVCPFAPVPAAWWARRRWRGPSPMVIPCCW